MATVTVPISRHDAHMVDQWVESIKKFGGLENHTMVFVPTLSVKSKAYEAMGRLSKVCGDIKVHELDMDNDSGWPKAPNWQWFKTVEFMESIPTPWLWMELDCLPVRGGWMDAISGAYTSSGAMFLGSVVKVPWREDEYLPPDLSLPPNQQRQIPNPNAGKIVLSPFGENDTMMCGCGVYPSRLQKRINDVGQNGMLQSFSKGFESASEPFDVFMRFVFREMGVGNTDLIQDHWNTALYRLEGNRLFCGENPNPAKDQEAFIARSRAGRVNPNAAIIHGCKDDSLARLVMAGLDTRSLEPLAPPLEAVKASIMTPEIAALDAKIEAVQKETRGMFEALLEKLQPPKQEAPAPAREPAPRLTDEPLAALLSQSTETDAATIIVDYLKTHTKSIRVGDLAKELKINESNIRQMAQDPACPFSVAKPSGWVKLKAA